MTLNPPRPLVPLLPLEYVPAKINLESTLSRYADRRKDIIIMAWDVSNKSARESDAIVRVEQTPRGELVSASDGVRWFNTGNSKALVVLPSIRILEEFSKVVQMEAGAISMPSWKAEGWIRTASGS